MTTQEGGAMQDDTVGNWQLWLAAEAIVVGKFGIYAVWRELQRVRDDALATQAARIEALVAACEEARDELRDLRYSDDDYYPSDTIAMLDAAIASAKGKSDGGSNQWMTGTPPSPSKRPALKS